MVRESPYWPLTLRWETSADRGFRHAPFRSTRAYASALVRPSPHVCTNLIVDAAIEHVRVRTGFEHDALTRDFAVLLGHNRAVLFRKDARTHLVLSADGDSSLVVVIADIERLVGAVKLSVRPTAHGSSERTIIVAEHGLADAVADQAA
jgi:hypothetical protein